MVAKVYTGTTNGIEGILVCVEADISDGLPMFDMVGYLGAEVKEARERVRTALKNSGFRLPPSHITVNLSPADLRKQGNYFDLPIALSVLAAAGFVRMDELENKIFIGELGSCAEGKCEGSCLSAGDSCLRDENVKGNCGTVK